MKRALATLCCLCLIFPSAISLMILTEQRVVAATQSETPSAQSSSNPASASASETAGHRRMLALLDGIRKRAQEDHPYHGVANLRRLKAKLAALSEEKPIDPILTKVDRWLLYFDLGEEELLLGNEEKAIEYLSQAYTQLPELKDYLRQDLPIILSFRLGVAYLRWAETRNCSLQMTPESCIFPIKGGGIHIDKEPSKRAIRQFAEVLLHTAKDSELNLRSRWLLNIAYMTIGLYPDAIPDEYVIPRENLSSGEEFPHFPSVASRLGLDTFSLSGGVIGEDFNNDGYLDLVVSTWDTSGQVRFFVNNRDGTFSDRTQESGLEGLYGGLSMLHADYDNDGDPDIMILRGAWLAEWGRHPNSLLRNDGNGVFTDVTFEAGLGEAFYPTQAADWADYDNDGDLDLYVGNESSHEYPIIWGRGEKILEQSSKQAFPSQLFRNNGNGTFTDVARAAGVTNDRFAKAVSWGDYDGDRLADLYVSNLQGANRLYHNNGDGTFTDVADKLGVTLPQRSFPAWFWDFDNDGALDLFVAAYVSGIEHTAASYLGLPVEVELARLYRGDGRGHFDDVTRQQNLTRPTAPMGANFGDLDNDGYLDFYLGTGYPDYEEITPNEMYLNKRGKRFVDVATEGGFGHLQKGHGVVFADFDNDGDQDIFEQMGGALLGDRFSDALYENPGFGNHWITVRLIGVRSNRSAIGARIRLEINENGSKRNVFKWVNTGGSFGSNPLRQTIGCGKATKIEQLEVFWPTSGETQRFLEVPVDQFIEIQEGEQNYRSFSLDRYVLGQGAPQDSPMHHEHE